MPFSAHQIGRDLKGGNCTLTICRKCKFKQVIHLCPSDWQTNEKTDNIWWKTRGLLSFGEADKLLQVLEMIEQWLMKIMNVGTRAIVQWVKYLSYKWLTQVRSLASHIVPQAPPGIIPGMISRASWGVVPTASNVNVCAL